MTLKVVVGGGGLVNCFNMLELKQEGHDFEVFTFIYIKMFFQSRFIIYGIY